MQTKPDDADPDKRQNTAAPAPYECYPELVRRALARDEAAWRCLVDSLSDVVWKTLNTFDLPRADREDAFSATFFSLFRNLSKIEDPRRLQGWAAVTARNEARTICRKQNRLIPVDQVPLADINWSAPDERLLDDELTHAALAAFATLNPKQQAVLRLHVAVPHLLQREIAHILDIPQGTIGPTVTRAIETLRDLLRPHLDGEL